MSESNDASPKKYPAHPQELRRLRRRGEVWQSRELTAAVALAAGIAVVGARLGPLTEMLRESMVRLVRVATDPATGRAAALAWAAREARACLAAAVPVLLCVTIAAAVTSFVQVGPLVTLAPLNPDLTRLNPAAGLKRVFGGGDALLSLGRTLLKMVVLGAVGYAVVRDSLAGLLRLGDRPAEALGPAALQILGPLLTRGLYVLFGFAILDVFYQRHRYRRKTMVSAAQAKEQSKKYDENPETKRRQREAYQELAIGRMLLEAETGDVGLRNPTHLFCILRFDPKREGAPRLIAKGRGKLAEKLKAIARAKGMYVEPNRRLARALYQLPLQTEVPPELYEAAAEVLRWAERDLAGRGETARWNVLRGGGAEPDARQPV